MAQLIERDFFDQAWLRLLKLLITRGEERSPRGKKTLELRGVSIVVQESLGNLLDHPGRGINMKFAVAEWLWIMAGSANLADIAQYNSKLRAFSDDGVKLAGAYGPRLVPQFQWALDKLREEDSRQAVLSIWTPKPGLSKDIPCTLSVHFLLRGKLDCIVTMRSSDAWLGLPYDFFVFSQLQNCFAGILNVACGELQFDLHSAHLYVDDHLEKAKGCIDDYAECEIMFSPGVTMWPPEVLINVFERPLSNETHVLSATDNLEWLPYARVLTSPRGEARGILTAHQP